MKWISIFIVLLLVSCEVTTELRSEKTYVIITFDDQHESIYSTALPIMQEFGFRATSVINTGVIGGDDKLTWSQVEELEFEHGWETAGHTLHHITLPTVPIEVVEYEIHQDWLNLIDHGLCHSTFALPGGKASQEHYDIILQYYQNVRTSLNITTYAPIDRTDLGYYPYLSCYSAENAKARILQAKQNKECIVIIGFHRVLEEADGHPANCKPEDFYKIMQFISANDLEVITIKEACELLSG
ncbi:MAG: polysaccharide deacetylase family protein [Candidatus Cloacimonetes bacterium]|nr:polysaccharide deacetylase family protein [Candidatus Cloacimonadota bacterium]